MSILTISHNKKTIDTRKNFDLLHRCFATAAKRNGGMRDVFRGDMSKVVASVVSKVA